MGEEIDGRLSFDYARRENDLREVTRFSDFPLMFYRTNLAEHSDRVENLVRILLAEIKEGSKLSSLDSELCLAIAQTHDDPEIITGDIPSPKKNQMSNQEQKRHIIKEFSAAQKLVLRYGPTFRNYDYEKLLEHSILGQSPEYVLVNFVDKLEALGEVLHEIHNGNDPFRSSPEGRTIPPTEYYRQFLHEVVYHSEKDIGRLFELSLCQQNGGLCPFQESVRWENSFYEWWFNCHQNSENSRVKESLYLQREFPNPPKNDNITDGQASPGVLVA
jgi:5'-deoxynucleotidase YfbR-like HD superfamily hydrolase